MNKKELIEFNKKELIRAKDRIRKFNKRYNTSIKLDASALNINSKTFSSKIRKMTANLQNKELKEVKSKKAATKENQLSKLIKAKKIKDSSITINNVYIDRWGDETTASVTLTKKQFNRMIELQERANYNMRKLGFEERYEAKFLSMKGYETYISILEARQTQQAILEQHNMQLNRFREGVLNALELIQDSTSSYEVQEELKRLYEKTEIKLSNLRGNQKLYNLMKEMDFSLADMAMYIFRSPEEDISDSSGDSQLLIDILKKF